MRRQYLWKLTIAAILATLVSCPAVPVWAQHSETPSTNHAAPPQTEAVLASSPRPCKVAVSEAKLIVRGDDYLVHWFTSPGCSRVFHTTICTGKMRCLASSGGPTTDAPDREAHFHFPQLAAPTYQQLIHGVKHDKERIYVVVVEELSFLNLKRGEQDEGFFPPLVSEVTLSAFRLTDGVLLGTWNMQLQRRDAPRFRLIEDGVTCCGHSITFKGDKPVVQPLSVEGPPTTTPDNEE